MNKIFLIALLPIVLFCDFGLSKIFDNNKEASYNYIDQSLKKLANYKKGSYWVYHNDSLNINDTVSVVDYQQYWYTSPYGENYIHYFERIDVIMWSFLGGGNISDHIRAIGFSPSLSRSYNLTQNTDILPTSIFEMSPSGANGYFIFNQDLWEILTNYILNNVKYDTVYHLTSFKYNDEYFFAPNKGIIKKVKYTNPIKSVGI